MPGWCTFDQLLAGDCRDSIDGCPAFRRNFGVFRPTTRIDLVDQPSDIGVARNRANIAICLLANETGRLRVILKLRQVCCNPRLLKLEAAKKVEDSAKLTRLMDMLPAMIEEGRRILLFSQFTSMLSLIEAELKAQKIDFLKLTDCTKNRAELVDRFQMGASPLFLIGLKAGGSGLNPTAADTVIHYDPWWNPAVEDQATDRAHRIGQEMPVFVYKLRTLGTVEEKIQELQARISNNILPFAYPTLTLRRGYESKRPPFRTAMSLILLCFILVAGVGFEPTTFRL